MQYIVAANYIGAHRLAVIECLDFCRITHIFRARTKAAQGLLHGSLMNAAILDLIQRARENEICKTRTIQFSLAD
eukprot:6195543-Pleurochrysis_carterae.AAC.5